MVRLCPPQADCKSLLGDGLSRHYLCNPCVGAWTPNPQRPFSAFARFFLKENGLTLDVRGSARQICPCNATSTENRFSGLQSFRNVQALIHLWWTMPPGCTHHYNFKSYRAADRLHCASPGSLPALRCGIATYPTRATDTAGLPPAGLQPCRLLRRPFYFFIWRNLGDMVD